MEDKKVIENENKTMTDLDKYRLENYPNIVNCIIFSRTGNHTPVYAKIIGYIKEKDIIIVKTLKFYSFGIHYHNNIGFAKIIKYKNIETLVIFDFIIK